MDPKVVCVEITQRSSFSAAGLLKGAVCLSASWSLLKSTAPPIPALLGSRPGCAVGCTGSSPSGSCFAVEDIPSPLAPCLCWKLMKLTCGGVGHLVSSSMLRASSMPLVRRLECIGYAFTVWRCEMASNWGPSQSIVIVVGVSWILAASAAESRGLSFAGSPLVKLGSKSGMARFTVRCMLFWVSITPLRTSSAFAASLCCKNLKQADRKAASDDSSSACRLKAILGVSILPCLIGTWAAFGTLAALLWIICKDSSSLSPEHEEFWHEHLEISKMAKILRSIMVRICG
mmetsp:Transcript_46715/g.82346  ORF Transcript_46715/g.82346 Transcript_46715/m.82346 type:complete len:288 (-) Transcript_46715:64-927(-)